MIKADIEQKIECEFYFFLLDESDVEISDFTETKKRDVSISFEVQNNLT